jgi:putative transposase
VLECLTERELLRRGEQMPERYIRGEDCRWRSPPGERWAEQYGFIYQVHSSDEINPTLQRNIQHLEDFCSDSCPPVGADAVTAVLSSVEAEPGIKLNELLDRVQDIASSDDVLTLIASEQIFVDLRSDPVPEPDRVRCYRDESTARASLVVSEQIQRSASRRLKSVSIEVDTMVMWDGRPWRIVNVGETAISLLSSTLSIW